jgi:hypothetical protein
MLLRAVPNSRLQSQRRAALATNQAVVLGREKSLFQVPSRREENRINRPSGDANRSMSLSRRGEGCAEVVRETRKKTSQSQERRSNRKYSHTKKYQCQGQSSESRKVSFLCLWSARSCLPRASASASDFGFGFLVRVVPSSFARPLLPRGKGNKVRRKPS